MASVTKSFTFDLERDKDLLDLLDRQDRRGRSALVRQALREFLQAERSPVAIEGVVERACRRAIRLELAGRLVVSEAAGEGSGLDLLSPESEAARNLQAIEDAFEDW